MMSEETTGLPFRTLDQWNRDAVAYCPICCSAEVRLVGTFTMFSDILIDVNDEGARIKNYPRCESHEEAAKLKLQRVGLELRCSNEHNFHIWFHTLKGLTWANVLHEGKSPLPPRATK